MTRDHYDVVIPTVGRPTLDPLLRALEREHDDALGSVVVVDDRTEPADDVVDAASFGLRVEVRRSGGVGPAGARNVGWAATRAPWVVFLDDDIELPRGWSAALAADLRACPDHVGGIQGRLVVPLPDDRRPTDWERNVAGLAHAAWATADMAYRRDALDAVGGFDERFPRAFREDADLALRVQDAGFALRRGQRHVLHPVRPAPWWVSVAKQLGNADDASMRRVHGRRWRLRAGAPRGRRARHFGTVTAAALTIGGLLSNRRRVATIAGCAWAAFTAEFAWARIRRGPRTPAEVATMLTTSVAIPFVASAAWGLGWVRALRMPARRLALVLVDRDGTIIHDEPYNGDPDRVRPVDGAREALDRLRAHGVRVGIVSNQSGIARGLLTADDVRRVNERVEELLGPFALTLVCPHGPDDGCECRKPAPGLIERARRELRVPRDQCAVIGDIAADVDAARRAGVLGVLVPNGRTRPDEIRAASHVAPDLRGAVELLLRETAS